jgi:hypothetical protein
MLDFRAKEGAMTRTFRRPTALITLFSGVFVVLFCLAGGAAAGLPDGAWGTLSPPEGRFGHAGVYDPVRDRMVFFGGTKSLSGANTTFNQVWLLDLSTTTAWSLVATEGTPPPARYAHTMVYDPVRDRMLVFGGYTNLVFLNDVWALSLDGTPTWTQLSPSGGPPAIRYGHVAVYDPLGDRMLVIGGGGTAGAYYNDVWALSLAGTPAWTQLAPANSPPLGRRGASAIYDAQAQRVVLFGGYRGSYLGDVWELPLTGPLAWSQVAVGGTGPSARAFHSATYDPGRAEMVVCGGTDGAHKSDAFALSLTGPATWSPIVTPGGTPGARGQHVLVRDPIRDRDILFAGLSSVILGDLWSLTRDETPAWTVVPASSPAVFAPRRHPCVVLDAPRDRLIVFGGSDPVGPLNDLWEWPLAPGNAIRPLTATGAPPTAKHGRSAIYDPARERMVVFGGFSSPAGPTNEVWELSLSGTPAWQQLATAGTPPLGRSQHSAVHRPAGDEMIVFGGLNEFGSTNDAWRLSLSEPMIWSAIQPMSLPSARYAHSAFLDPVGDRMYVFGGDPINGETWRLDLSGTPAWSQLPSGGPSARYGAAAVYDPLRRRGVLFGGTFGSSYLNDSWELRLEPEAQWAELVPDGPAPLGRIHSRAEFDVSRNRMIVLGGYHAGGSYATDTPVLQWLGGLDAGPVPGRSGASLALPWPNPSPAGVEIAFTVPAEARARVRVYDLGGRFVRELVDGSLPGGPHRLHWDRRASSGAVAPPGLYFLELKLGSERLTRRIVLSD